MNRKEIPRKDILLTIPPPVNLSNPNATGLEERTANLLRPTTIVNHILAPFLPSVARKNAAQQKVVDNIYVSAADAAMQRGEADRDVAAQQSLILHNQLQSQMLTAHRGLYDEMLRAGHADLLGGLTNLMEDKKVAIEDLEAIDGDPELKQRAAQSIEACYDSSCSHLGQLQVRTQRKFSRFLGTPQSDSHFISKLQTSVGDMSRTLIIIDISASMTNAFPGSYARPNWQAGDNAWINVRRRIRDYLELLPVGSFRILCFNHELVEHPYDTATWCRTTEERSAALAFLDQRTPVGLTFTEAALRRAALFQPTSILLFTDGQPTKAADEKQPDGTVKSVGEVDVEQQQRILKLHDENVLTCPVNVVALNGYADPVFFSFLQELAGRTGGSFQGL